MDLTQPKDLSSSLQPTSQSSSAALDLPASRYLKVPATRSSRGPRSLLESATSDKINSSRNTTPSNIFISLPPPTREDDLSKRFYMSVTSNSSVDTDFSVCSSPPARSYRVPRFHRMSEKRRITEPEKQQYIHALQTHQLNTLVDLRRVEKAFAVLGTPDCSQSMTSAWSYYVESHGLLTELRGLTKNFPFSSECLDEAKRRVFSDPESNRSWNLCWLLLSKIENDQLIPEYARRQASLPAMWAGHKPTTEEITRLANAFTAEWEYAIRQFLRHWEQPPTI